MSYLWHQGEVDRIHEILGTDSTDEVDTQLDALLQDFGEMLFAEGEQEGKSDGYDEGWSAGYEDGKYAALKDLE